MLLETQVEIDAPMALVWDVLTDLPNYGAWNPFVVAVTGAERPRPGQFLRLHVDIPGARSRVSRNRVVEVCAPGYGRTARLGWAFAGALRHGGFVLGYRQQILEALPNGRTRYSTHEELRGWLVGFMPKAGLREGFRQTGEALREYCEARSSLEVVA